jgi:diadenosine tetraphosphatase ApaH/serine/threonine PP2A family protein phosphatase
MIHSILQVCDHDTPGSSPFATSTQVLSVISQAVNQLSAEPPVLHLTGQFVVVGDIHGDILSVVRIFQELGWPDTRSYLFLGDYVDRGNASCEVLVLLYCLKVIFPDSIFLLRGNHEFASMTQLYGFRAECAAKFVSQVYTEFVNSFSALPIAAIVNGTVFCVHGGIRPELARHLDDLMKIEDGSASIEADILWADPREGVDGFQASPRGRGFLFGSDAFEDFLDDADLTLMIRAHEDCDAGFAWPFGIDGQLLTVFSTADYCQKGNDAAVAVVSVAGVRIVRFPFKSAHRSRTIIPCFVLEAQASSLPDLMLQPDEDTSRLYIELF